MPKGRSPQLPPHLSYKAALVLLPPSAIQAPIESLRKTHDRNFNRWPPHINLIYPFLKSPSRSLDAIRPRLKAAVDVLGSFQLQLSSASHFLHSQKSATVWLQPTDAGSLPAATEGGPLRQLQASLQAAFAECDADDRDYTPHLSIGQARGEEAARELEFKVDLVVADFMGTDATVKDGMPGEAGLGDHATWSFEWTVDRVCVLERTGFHGRFRIVDEILLSDSMHQQSGLTNHQE